MNWLARLMQLLKGEQRIVESDAARFLFFASDEIDEIWVRTTAQEAAARGCRVQMVIVGGVSDRLKREYAGTSVSLLELDGFAHAAGLSADILITASTGINREILPIEAQYFVHMPHSLVSFHMIYPADVFDGYDIVFAAGPHHVAEFAEICERRGLRRRKSAEIGYGKMDYFRSLPNQKLEPLSVLLAPSWGPDDLLSRMGEELIEELARRGYTVYVRPHPLIFSEKPELIERLKSVSAGLGQCIIEDPRQADTGLLVSATIVTDYSGIGFEFAALRNRPVLFVDVGRKEVNSEWREYENEPIEIGLRQSIGRICEPSVLAVAEAVGEALQAPLLDQQELDDFIFGANQDCAARAVDELVNIVDGGQRRTV